jgi:hypothetical protein
MIDRSNKTHNTRSELSSKPLKYTGVSLIEYVICFSFVLLVCIVPFQSSANGLQVLLSKVFQTGSFTTSKFSASGQQGNNGVYATDHSVQANASQPNLDGNMSNSGTEADKSANYLVETTGVGGQTALYLTMSKEFIYPDIISDYEPRVSINTTKDGERYVQYDGTFIANTDVGGNLKTGLVVMDNEGIQGTAKLVSMFPDTAEKTFLAIAGNDGLFDEQDAKKASEKYGIELEDLQKYNNVFDSNGDNTITLSEFRAVSTTGQAKGIEN